MEPKISKATVVRQCGIAKISYKNSKGEQITFTTNENNWYAGRDAEVLYKTVNKYFTENDPNITPKEQISLRIDFAKQQRPVSGLKHNSSDKMDLYAGFDFVLDTFTKEDSDGGKNITPNEIYQMYEIFHFWTANK